MKSLKESVKNWFGFTRRERRASFILVIIILMVFGLRFVVPGRDLSIKEIPLNFSKPLISEFREIPKAEYNGSFQKKIYSPSQQRRIIELNTCDSVALKSLPGIGPVLSSRIVKYRNLIGGYVLVDQLREVYGLSEETFKLISSRLRADSGLIRKIRINSAEFRGLIRHPYFKKDEVSGILKYRELQGKIKGLDVLIKNNIISSATAKKIRPYLDFGE